jgi:hypothetical protein
MTTPYEFGQRVGSDFEKEARGLLADAALYSNPWTGVPTGIYDTYNSLRSGNYLGAAGNVAATGLSFMGGGLLSGGAKALGKGVMRAGMNIAGRGAAQTGARAAAGNAVRQVGRGITGAGQMMGNAAKTVAGGEQALSRGIQRVIPARPNTTSMMGKARNWAVNNPLTMGAFMHNGGAARPSSAQAQAQLAR